MYNTEISEVESVAKANDVLVTLRYFLKARDVTVFNLGLSFVVYVLDNYYYCPE